MIRLRPAGVALSDGGSEEWKAAKKMGDKEEEEELQACSL
jgi:hypothetical protein